jgi:RimJ/RimL family protein N-acetyltransferase
MPGAIGRHLPSAAALAERLKVDVPMLETERLRLRPWNVRDAGAYQAMLADSEVMRYLGSGPLFRARRLAARLVARFTELEARRELARLADAWRGHGLGMWAIENRGDGALLGAAGFSRLGDWREGPTNIEIGWTFARAAWGHGYATEAAACALRYGFTGRGLKDVISVAPVAHERSIRVMQRLGMRPQGRTRWRRLDVVWYTLDRAQWEQAA